VSFEGEARARARVADGEEGVEPRGKPEGLGAARGDISLLFDNPAV